MKNKKAYFIEEEGSDYGLAVVAYSAREAKKLGYQDDMFADVDWVDMRTTWKRDIDVSKLQIGVMKNHLLALKLGIYGFIEEEICLNCKNENTTVYYEDGKYYCSNCDSQE